MCMPGRAGLHCLRSGFPCCFLWRACFSAGRLCASRLSACFFLGDNLVDGYSLIKAGEQLAPSLWNHGEAEFVSGSSPYGFERIKVGTRHEFHLLKQIAAKEPARHESTSLMEFGEFLIAYECFIRISIFRSGVALA